MAARLGTARVARRISSEDFGRLEHIVINVAAYSAGSHEAGLETLWAAILDDTLPPGARLPQADLATPIQRAHAPTSERRPERAGRGHP
jgi:hypothetical protein